MASQPTTQSTTQPLAERTAPEACAAGAVPVGQVRALWRYPVKSMLGERLDRLEVEPRGVVGDRQRALWDPRAQRVASAKDPRRWAGMLRWRARYLSEPRPGEPLPVVALQGPPSADGVDPDPLRSDDPGLAEHLSRHFGRQLTLLHQPPPGASLDQYWPDVEGRALREATDELVLPEGTFFDACPIHALTTATLAELRRLEPDLDFAVERFRPNLLIDSGAAVGFVEEGWIGGVLAIGPSLRLRVDGGCPRCVVTTLAQGDLPETLEILRATARHNRVVAGIRLSVLSPGPLALGDPVRWLPPA
ncbi:MAG: MOSC domain-containing protein [Cyanobacteriota bacterium]|nr:MOSC domain-containing protein [Cyanobacteriota bacterium]